MVDEAQSGMIEAPEFTLPEQVYKGAVKYTCNKCTHSWEIEISAAFLTASDQHLRHLNKSLDHPMRKETAGPDGVVVPPLAKCHDEFICKNCGEMRELTNRYIE